MKKFDIAIIGSGPGGYVCAIRCAQLGMKVCLIEKYQNFGGTCLNVGCIPSKALLDSSEHYHQIKDLVSIHGIEVGKVVLNFEKMMARKTAVVKQMNQGIAYLMKKNRIETFYGHASFQTPKILNINSSQRSESIQADKTIIATGSKPVELPFLPFDKKMVISSTEMLSLKKVPKKLLLIGGGVIGLELGSVFARLGTKVQVIEFLDNIIANFQADIAQVLKKSLEAIGIDFFLEHKVLDGKVINNHVHLSASNAKGEKRDFQADLCMVAVGRKPYTKDLGLEKIGVAVEKHSQCIKVNPYFETSIDGIFAIGDVIGGKMLAHKASEEGTFVAETIAGQKPIINHLLIPNVVYTEPEIASVGLSETDVNAKNIPFKKGVFPMKGIGRAASAGKQIGFFKVLAHKQTDEILGVEIICSKASELIAEAVIAMTFRASAQDVAMSCHAHPTYSEAFKEACLMATDNRAIHA